MVQWSVVDGCYLTAGISDNRGGLSRGRGVTSYYSNRDKDPRMGQTTGRDRDRPNHYRSYTK